MSRPSCSLMPLGDSITEGSDGFVVYRGLLLGKLRTAGHPVHYVGSRNGPSQAGGIPLPHQGYSGKDIGYIAGMFAEAYRLNPADIVLLHAGHNRSFEENPVPDIVRHTEAIIETARRINPRVTLLISQVIPAGKLPKYSYIPELNRELESLVSTLNARTTKSPPVILVNHARGFDWKTDTVADRVHPNASGAAKMADNWAHALAPVLTRSIR